MSKKPVEVPNIGFNEALKRIAKFDKNDLIDEPVKNQKKNHTYKKHCKSVRICCKRSEKVVVNHVFFRSYRLICFC